MRSLQGSRLTGMTALYTTNILRYTVETQKNSMRPSSSLVTTVIVIANVTSFNFGRNIF